jgi:hypothetical protein
MSLLETGIASETPIADLALAFLGEYNVVVKTHWASNPLPRRAKRVLFSQGGYTVESPGDVAWASVVYGPMEQAFECAHAEPFAAAVRSLKLPRTLADPDLLEWEQLKHFTIRETLAPLVDAYRDIGSLDVDENAIRAQWHRWETHWRLNTEHHLVAVPLVHASGLENAVALGDRIELRPLTPELKTQIWDPNYEVFGILTLQRFSGATVLLEVTSSEARAVGAGVEAEIEEAARAVLALRLAAEGDVSPIGAIHTPLAPSIWRSSALVQFQGYTRRFLTQRPARPSKLTPEVLREAREIHGELLKIEQDTKEPGLKLPLRRFEQTYAREWLEDVIVDLAIVLESTLLVDVPGEELKYRTALRGSALLRNIFDPEDTMLLLRRLYDVRSAIVHRGVQLGDIAGKKSFNWLTVESFLPEAENRVRSVLRKFVRECAAGGTVHTVADRLEREILSVLASGTTAQRQN